MRVTLVAPSRTEAHRARKKLDCMVRVAAFGSQEATEEPSGRQVRIEYKRPVDQRDAAVEILQQPDLAGRFFPFAVARYGDEVDGSFEIDFADQVREENARALQPDRNVPGE